MCDEVGDDCSIYMFSVCILCIRRCRNLHPSSLCFLAAVLQALSGEVLNTMREIVINSPVYRDTLSQVIADGKFVVGDNPAHLADFGMFCPCCSLAVDFE